MLFVINLNKFKLRYHITFLIYIFTTVVVFSQSNFSQITGKITDNSNEIVIGASVFLKKSKKGTSTNISGNYTINNLIPGKYTVVVSMIGFHQQEKEIVLKENSKNQLNFILKENVLNLKEVEIKAKKAQDIVREQSFTVNSIEAIQFKNLTVDASKMLDNRSGIRIRKSGGFGSEYNFSLNGLSDYRVRFFIDDIPVDYLGEAYKLYNIPVSFIDRINVYKGVVPIKLGADALGGAVNIITPQKRNSFIDASYSFGSFNTHLVSLNSQYRNTKNGFTIRPKAFYNFSNNNYTMKDVRVYDKTTNVWNTLDVERFHNDYQSKAATAEIGYTYTNWADELLVSFTGSEIASELQTDIYGNPVGEVNYKEKTNVTSIKYAKSNLLNDKLSVKLFGVYNNLKSVSIDTTANRYNWLGEIQSQIPGNNTGEIANRKTLFEYNQESYVYRAYAGYKLKENQLLSANYVGLNVARKGENRLGVSENEPFKSPNTIAKNVLGFSYETDLFDDNLNIIAATKYYNFDIFTRNAKYVATDNNTVIENINTNQNKLGYAISARYFFTPNLYVKSSFEKGYRLPEPHEIFGDGLSVAANPNLLPETSNNINLGLNYTLVNKHHQIKTQFNFFTRDVSNYIQKVPLGRQSAFINVRDVLIYGLEADFNYTYNKRLNINASFSRQFVLNNVKYNETGEVNRVYKDQLPNQPYMFGFLGANYQLVQLKNIDVAMHYNMNYVHEFYRGYQSIAIGGAKNIIPSQFTNDIGFTLSSKDKKYNLSVESTNIFNATIFDNFNIQKPGRAFYLKLRYNLQKI